MRPGLTLLILLSSACSVYDPALLDGQACELRSIPAAPAEPGGDGEEVAFALRNVVLDQNDGRWSTIGYDLDGLCSLDVEAQRECNVPDGQALPELDGPGGVDNVFGRQVANVLFLVHPEFQGRTRDRMTRGDGALLLRLRGWDGRDEDATVVAELSHTVVGTPTLQDGGVPDLPDAGGLPEPRWEGRDAFWSRDDDYLLEDPDQPSILDDHAHVVQRQLVMSLPERSTLAFDDGERSVAIRMTDGKLIARISGDGTAVDPVTIVGRWAVDELLDAVQATGLCIDTREYEVAVNLLDRVADVRSDASTAGRDLPCDAISVGLALTGTRARWAGLTPGASRSHACP